MYQQSEKKLINGNISFICPHSMLNFDPLTANSCWRVCGTRQISTGFATWQHYCTNVAQWTSTQLCRMFGCLLGWYTTYTFLGLLPPNGILRAAKFTLHPSLPFSYIGSVTAWQSSSGRQPKFLAQYKGMELWNFHRGHDLDSAWQPSRLASAHILVQ